ncbi:MAG: helix-turn-helix transcriptional regulator [Elusimicrobia bacterium]|nr:helix-turn-helix transcriptional regulator [Elusimicrobiota bacterium]
MKQNTKAIIKNPSDIGALVRQARAAAGLTQIQAARACGVGIRFLSDLENGKSSIHLGKTIQVLNGLGLRLVMKRKEISDE